MGRHFLANEFPQHILTSDQDIDVFYRLSGLMHRMWALEEQFAVKVQSGAYEGRDWLLKDDQMRVRLHVNVAPQDILHIDIRIRAGLSCDILWDKVKDIEWIIPANGDLMKELEACEFEVTTASVVTVSTIFPARFLLIYTDTTPHYPRRMSDDQIQGVGEFSTPRDHVVLKPFDSRAPGVPGSPPNATASAWPPSILT